MAEATWHRKDAANSDCRRPGILNPVARFRRGAPIHDPCLYARLYLAAGPGTVSHSVAPEPDGPNFNRPDVAP